jgi:alpha-N-arabinofuranosidase
MYAAHQGARAVRAVTSAPSVHWRDGEERDRSLWGLNGSASVNENTVTLTVTNSHMTEPRETEITLRGGTVRAVTATTLAARDIRDHNTFAEPDTVVPTTEALRVDGSPFVYRFPAASVTKLAITLGT